MGIKQLKNGLPHLTVLITAGNQRGRVANALASVLKQNQSAHFEIIILDCGDPENPPVAGSDRPNVKIAHFPAGVSGGTVRAQGVRMASAPVLVFLEEHAAACPGWAEAILRAFDDEKWTAVGPHMGNGNPACGISDALALTYYPLYGKPVSRQGVGWLPLHNTAYRREALLKHDKDLETMFTLEILLQWQLGADGCSLLFEPDMKVLHYYETDIPVMWKHEINGARAYIVNRAKLYAWPMWLRIARALGLPLLPLVRAFKLLVILLWYCPTQIGLYLVSLPVMLCIYVGFAFGEFLGLAFGARDGDARYIYQSVNADRQLPSDFPHFSV